ncbi:MAG: PAS domain S-box protein, partial [Bacteroidetes bacterium]
HLNYLFVNPRAAAFWGLQPTDLIGKNWRQMAPTDEKFQEYEQHITHVFSTREKVVLHEVTVLAQDTKPRWFTMSFVPIVGDDNTVKQVMVSATEITNSVLDREKIQLQTSELKEIAFIQSHMVRSPLANIQGLLQLIQDTCTDKETNKEQIEMLQLVQHEAKKLDKLLLDIVQKSYQLRQADNL